MSEEKKRERVRERRAKGVDGLQRSCSIQEEKKMVNKMEEILARSVFLNVSHAH